MPLTAFCFSLQIIRILHRLLIRVFHQTGVAAKGIRNDGLLLFHKITSKVSFLTKKKR